MSPILFQRGFFWSFTFSIHLLFLHIFVLQFDLTIMVTPFKALLSPWSVIFIFNQCSFSTHSLLTLSLFAIFFFFPPDIPNSLTSWSSEQNTLVYSHLYFFFKKRKPFLATDKQTIYQCVHILKFPYQVFPYLVNILGRDTRSHLLVPAMYHFQPFIFLSSTATLGLWYPNFQIHMPCCIT